MHSVSCVGTVQGNWKWVLFQSTLLLTGIALTILGGLKLSSVIHLQGVNSFALIGAGAGVVGVFSIFNVVCCVKHQCRKLPSPRSEQVPVIAATIAEQLPKAKAERGEREWSQCREANKAGHISMEAFQELVNFLENIHDKVEADKWRKAIANGDLLNEWNLNLTNIDHLPDSVGYLISLTSISISESHQLTSLPESLKNLTELKYFTCIESGLTSVPDTLGHLSNLEVLILSNNNTLTTLPSSLQTLGKLRSLRLVNTPLLSLPASFTEMMTRKHSGGEYIVATDRQDIVK